MKINYRTTGTLTKAGLAYIEYDEKVNKPHRKKDLIVLPTKGYELFQADESFQQFLFIGDEKSKDFRDRYQSCWFGGTDELPFLVEMKDDNWLDIWKSDSFYDTIIPDVVKSMMKNFGGIYKRQGDIFAYPFPNELQDIEKIKALMLVTDNITNMWLKSDRKQILGTRHMLDGEMTIHYKNPVARGIIKAPDHEDLVLDRWHILSQTKFLDNPSQAD